MVDLPKLSETKIAAGATRKVFQRGSDYCNQGAIKSLVKRGDLITATVRGTYSYHVSVSCAGNKIESAKCSCPYEYEGWCKHIVGTLLSLCRYPEKVEERPSLTALLAELDKPQMIDVLIELTVKKPDLLNQIEKILHKKYRDYLPQEPGIPKAFFDITYYRQQVQEAVRQTEEILETLENSDGYWDEEYPDNLPYMEIADLIDEVRQAALGGRSEEAIAALKAIADTFADEWSILGNYGIEADEILYDLDYQWAEFILMDKVSEPERISLYQSLKTWRDIHGSGYSRAILAIEQGWDLPALVKVLENPNEAVTLTQQERESIDNILLPVRFNVLKRQHNYEEYLALATATNSDTEFLLMLAYLDRIEEVMANRGRIYDKAQALTVAKALVEADAMDEAIAIAQGGLNLEEGHSHDTYELAKFIAAIAQETDQTDLCVAGLLKAVKTFPRLADFEELMDLAGDDWPLLKADLFDHLLHFKGHRDYYGSGAERVRIFLAGNYLEGAMVLGAKLGVDNEDLLQQVMELALPKYPQWVIENAIARAEPIMDGGKSSYYQQAATWLSLAKRGYEVMDKLPQWQQYLEEIMTKYSRKYALMPLLRKL